MAQSTGTVLCTLEAMNSSEPSESSASPNVASPGQTNDTSNTKGNVAKCDKSGGGGSKPHYRFLNTTEWTTLAQGIGAIRDTEDQKPTHPKSWWWPPRGMVRGLYRDIIRERVIFCYLFHVTSISRWGFMIVQLFIGASLTALGPQLLHGGIPITVLGAANTIIAGLLALLHNSGLPDRYRHNMAEFEVLEDRIRELLDSGLVPVDETIDQTLAECFDHYHQAKVTVAANMPVTYNSKRSLQGLRGTTVATGGSQTQVTGQLCESQGNTGLVGLEKPVPSTPTVTR